MSVSFPELRERRRLGRFELRRQLGRGAQATVWLAEDPHLERPVALKCLDPRAGQAMAKHWLNEARAVSRLSHPHIVPLFEADLHDGVACLVFEFVDGSTLAELRRRRGPLAAPEAAQLMLGVLDGLALAHRHGIVHRDLKPSNVLIDAEGRPRVMDFGIAARASGPADGLVAGTPGYMSPEAARGEAPRPAMDVFAAGAMLAELLGGERLGAGGDVRGWLARAQREDFRLAGHLRVDDTLRAIVDRALAREPTRRFDDAQAMRDALQQWLTPAMAGSTVTGHGTLEFLLRRMRHRTDFPALSEAVQRIQRVTRSETESLASLCDEVLKDVALTNKILRLVNTAHYAGSGGGIGTISRAVQLVGFAGIRNMAMSLLLLEHLQDRGQAGLLRQEFLRALTAGTLAAELAGCAAEREQVFLGAMLQGLGRLLTEYYLPEDGREIRERLRAAMPGHDGEAERQRISAQVLGLSFEDLGIGVVRSWGLPESLHRCMRRASADPPRRAVEGDARPAWLATAANAMTDALLDGDADTVDQRIRGAAARHAAAIGQALDALLQAVQRARERMRDTVQALDLGDEAGPALRRLIAVPDVAPAEEGALDALQVTVASGRPDTPTIPARVPATAANAADRLAAGLQDVTQALMASDFPLPQVLRMVLESILRGLDLQRVVFCMRDARAQTLLGRFGLGLDATALCPVFRIPLDQAPVHDDLFAAVCRKGADTMISDASEPRIAARLPAWYRAQVEAPTFLLLPMMLKGRPVGLIYGDRAEAGSIAIDAAALAMLRSLRNQAVLAFRQAG